MFRKEVGGIHQEAMENDGFLVAGAEHVEFRPSQHGKDTLAVGERRQRDALAIGDRHQGESSEVCYVFAGREVVEDDGLLFFCGVLDVPSSTLNIMHNQLSKQVRELI